MIKVLIIDDSKSVQEFLTEVLGSDPSIEVIGVASSGEEALQALEHTRPDVVTMDIHMPKMNGFETTRRIMETQPTPIVIVSGSDSTQSVATTFQALQAGALSVVARPPGVNHPEYEAQAHALIKTVKLMSEVRVIRRWPRLRPHNGTASATPLAPEVRLQNTVAFKLVAIGASTGGPPVLQSILAQLPQNFSAPIVVVQHMAAGFVAGFVEWLAQTTGRAIHVGRYGENLLPGHVYVAPDNHQMTVNVYGRILLSRHCLENDAQPSVSALFHSVAESFGAQVAGVLLTGMGKDGAAELKLMKDGGALTLVQDRASSIVYGMPGEAIRLNAATHVLTPDQIAVTLTQWASNHERSNS